MMLQAFWQLCLKCREPVAHVLMSYQADPFMTGPHQVIQKDGGSSIACLLSSQIRLDLYILMVHGLKILGCPAGIQEL